MTSYHEMYFKLYYTSILFQEFLSKDASRKIIQRTRAIQLPALPRNMNAIDIPQNLRQTIADIPSPFLLHDNEQNGSRLIIFSSLECLQQLGRSTSWYVRHMNSDIECSVGGTAGVVSCRQMLG